MITYFTEDSDFVFKGKLLNNRWLKMVAESEIKRIGDISIIFCSDNYILDVNIKYLQHDYFTDIITFDYVEGDVISGDMMISVDRVRENAKTFGVSFERELHRVIIHGVLHLLGNGDKSEKEAKKMRSLEDAALAVWDSLA